MNDRQMKAHSHNDANAPIFSH